VTTLVVCIDRSGTPAAEPPIVGWEAVQSLVTELGIEDPEDSRVNCVLEGLRVTRDLHDEDEDAVVAVITASGESVSADRAVARQTDELVAEFDPDSAVVVVDSAEDERLVPIIESRLQVDAVDRVVVRQARDIESTYYLLKQFLADEELRKTVLVPVGVALLAFPALLFVADSPAVAVGAIAAVIGLFFLYKGMGVDTYLARLPGEIKEALYSGQVSLVTYVVAGGLALIGTFAGAIGVSAIGDRPPLIVGMRFAFDSVPWLTAAALAASTGRLLDEIIRDERVRSAYVNLPFGAVAVGLVVRGFSAYFLERGGVFAPFSFSRTELGPVTIEGFTLAPGTRLALFIFAGVLISLVGVRFAAYFSGTSIEEEVMD
jgi:putative membrane protein